MVTLVVDEGNLTLTGKSIHGEMSVEATEGNLTLTGQITYAEHAVVAAEGNLAFVGKEIGLQVSGATVEPANLSMDGKAVGGGMVTEAAIGNLTLTGQDIAFDLTYSVEVEPANLTLAGKNVVLEDGANFVVGVDPTNLYYSGQSIALLYSGDPPAPAPAPAPHPELDGAPTGHRVAVRIDGRLYVGSYREISDLIERRAQQDAERSAQPTRTKARKAARRLVGDFRSAVQIEEPMLLAGVEPTVVASSMFRDLRALYNDALVNAMLEANRVRRQQDEEAAMRTAERLLMGD